MDDYGFGRGSINSNHFEDYEGRVGKYDAKVNSNMVRSWKHAVGVIGVGNMGAALVRGIATQAEGPCRSVAVCDLDQDRVDSLCKDLGVEDMSDAKAVAMSSELVILAAKPQNLGAILEQISNSIDPDQTIMSIMAGVTTDALERGLGREAPGHQGHAKSPCSSRAGHQRILWGPVRRSPRLPEG